eukprot:5554747-Pyramimonas_sp.AAC.1
MRLGGGGLHDSPISPLTVHVISHDACLTASSEDGLASPKIASEADCLTLQGGPGQLTGVATRQDGLLP